LDCSSRRRFSEHHKVIFKSTTGSLQNRYERIRSLKASPHRGRPGHRTGTRELPLTPLPYVVVYSVKPEAVEILHIHHGAQDWR